MFVGSAHEMMVLREGCAQGRVTEKLSRNKKNIGTTFQQKTYANEQIEIPPFPTTL